MYKKIVSVLVILLCQQVKCTKILFDKIVRQNAQKGLVQVAQKMRQRFVHFAKSIGKLYKNFVRENCSSFWRTFRQSAQFWDIKFVQFAYWQRAENVL